MCVAMSVAVQDAEEPERRHTVCSVRLSTSSTRKRGTSKQKLSVNHVSLPHSPIDWYRLQNQTLKHLFVIFQLVVLAIFPFMRADGFLLVFVCVCKCVYYA